MDNVPLPPIIQCCMIDDLRAARISCLGHCCEGFTCDVESSSEAQRQRGINMIGLKLWMGFVANNLVSGHPFPYRRE